MLNFIGLWCPNHLTVTHGHHLKDNVHTFHFVPIFWNCATGEATTSSWISGLILSALEMFTYVLSNKDVLGSTYISQLPWPVERLSSNASFPCIFFQRFQFCHCFSSTISLFIDLFLDGVQGKENSAQFQFISTSILCYWCFEFGTLLPL